MNSFLKLNKKSFSSAFKNVVIVAGKRTPIGSLLGQFSNVHATSLGAIAIKGAMKQSNIQKEDIDEVIMGNVISAGIGQAPARQAAIKAGLGLNTVSTTVNKVCASGIKSITLATQSIQTGQSSCVVAGGMENMSLVPHYIYQRQGNKYGDIKLIDGIQFDGLTDYYDRIAMGNCAEKTVKEYSITREEQDKYAHQSYERTLNADFSNEIENVEIEDPRTKKITILDKDEEPLNYNGKKMKDKINTLRPAFEKDGTITAANSSKINDGACALILMDEEVAKQKGLKPLARVLAHQDAELAPIDFGIAPATGITKLLKRNNLSIKDIDIFELNEAFASVALVNMKILGITPDKINLHGGAVALGHPIGMSGSRIVLSLMNVLKKQGKRLGVASICNGGGGSTSVLIENLN